MLLALDTATQQAGCAVYGESGVVAELAWQAGRNHSRDLESGVQEILRLARLTFRDLSSVAVASGPGSFSGVRVGIAYAKGLCLARDIPLAGISTLDILGYQASALSASVTAVLSAGRGDVYAARYEGRGESWHRLSDYALLPVHAAAEMASGSLLIGDGARDVADAASGEGLDAREAPALWQWRRPGFLAKLGQSYLDTGGADLRETLEPLYLRRSAAEESRAAGG
ncbi:MAG TPA: tRNA (adenosine(37)-N6)-threonylcarbamoyltransferase complex dimerization subunit type 1 TsaB [Chloroflexota bacterium]|nr:tRNA (adenosine(37)-N6)-threonylcarbamoyltransferase complex dimerization subunit type 1 TsaB [Chloroflexota bacterium]